MPSSSVVPGKLWGALVDLSVTIVSHDTKMSGFSTVYMTWSRATSHVGCECGALRKGSLWPKRLLLFDRCEGGIGIARRAHAHMAPLLRTALELMRSCPACRDGCVLCVHTSQCPEYNAGTDKRATVAIVERRPTLAEVAGAAAAVFTCCSFQCVCVFQAYSSTWQRPRPRLPFRSPMPGGLGPLELIHV